MRMERGMGECQTGPSVHARQRYAQLPDKNPCRSHVLVLAVCSALNTEVASGHASWISPSGGQRPTAIALPPQLVSLRLQTSLLPPHPTSFPCSSRNALGAWDMLKSGYSGMTDVPSDSVFPIQVFPLVPSRPSSWAWRDVFPLPRHFCAISRGTDMAMSTNMASNTIVSKG